MNDAIQDWTAPRRVKLTVEDFLRLDASGAFGSYAKTELIDGEVLAVSAQHRPHSFIKNELTFRLQIALRELASPLVPLAEVSVAMSSVDAPEPDIVVTSEPRGEGLVPLASVRLIVEVAATTLDFDLGRKLALYAGGGVPEYWVTDIRARIIYRFHAPRDGSYAERVTIAFGEPLVAATIPGLTIDTVRL